MRLAGVFLSLVVMANFAAAQSDAWLGLRLEVVETPEAKKLGIDGGLKVKKVEDKSPAQEAGFEAGDVILSAGELTVTTIEDMRKVMQAKKPGDMLSLGVRRTNGRNEPLLVTLGSSADKDSEFADDAKVKELREKLRKMDADRRKVQEELDERLEDLRSGKASTEDRPTPGTDPEKPDTPEPKIVKPDRTKLKVTLGASFKNLSVEDSAKHKIDGGIRVTRISNGGAAAEGGLEVDDIVVFIDGEIVAGTGDLRTLLAEHAPGDHLEFEVIRNGKRVKKTVVLRAKNPNG